MIYHSHIHLAARVHVFKNTRLVLLLFAGQARSVLELNSEESDHSRESIKQRGLVDYRAFVDPTVQETEREEESNVLYVSLASEETLPALIVHL